MQTRDINSMLENNNVQQATINFEELISTIQQQIALKKSYLEKKNDAAKINILQTLSDNLSNDPNNVLIHLNNARSALRLLLKNLFSRTASTTYQMIHDQIKMAKKALTSKTPTQQNVTESNSILLSPAQMPKPELINSTESEKKLAQEIIPEQITQPVIIPETIAKEPEVTTIAPTVTEENHVIQTAPIVESNQQTSVSDPMPGTNLDFAQKASEQLRQYAAQLKQDYERMDFIRRIWNGIKLKKSNKLNQLADSIDATPFEWKSLIEAAHKDGELIRGHFSHNTRNLLTNLQNEKFDLYIKEEPAQKVERKMR